MSATTAPSALPARATPLALIVRLFLPFALAYFASVLLRNVNAVAAPELIRDFGLNAADLGLLTSLYFMAFTLAQLPLGTLLDRFDSARVNAAALVVAAIGTTLFASANSTAALGLGRALIGLGVAICLMSSLRAFAIWLPVQQQPMVNGLMFAVGTLGAIAATVPAQWAIASLGWRTVFLYCAGFIVFAVVMLVTVAPPCRTRASSQPPVSLLTALGYVWRSRQARHSFPAVSFAVGVLWAVQSLWAGPWLTHVAGLSGDLLARVLICMPIGMLVGNLFHGWVTGRLRVANRNAFSYNHWMLVLFALTMVPFALKLSVALPVLFFAFGFFGAATNNYFALLSPYYPSGIVGRANAALNMGLFGSIFALQWGIGGVVNLYRSGTGTRTGTGYSPEGFVIAFAALCVTQILLIVWMWPARDDASRGTQA